MNKRRAKGNRIQRKLIDEMQRDGFIVSKAESGGKFNPEKDLFGLFDLVAIDCVSNKGAVHFIQVTTNRPHKHSDYQEFVDQCVPKAVVVQVVWYDRRGWKKFFYQPNTKPIIVDARK